MQQDLQIQICGDSGLTFKGVTYLPNRTCGFFEFTFSKAFPTANVYGTTLFAGVIERSYQTLLHQNLNLEHKLRIHDPEKKQDDMVIGSIVAVDFPKAPASGWTITSEKDAPAVTGVASFFKQVHRLDQIFGEHLTGRHNYTVSMEVDYRMSESGFAVEMSRASNGSPQRLQKDSEQNFTPATFITGGWEYWPWDKAPDALVATYSKKKNRIVSTYRGRRVLLLMGGLDNEVHYAGLAMVKYGAEPAAEILKTAASAPTTQPQHGLINAFAGLREACELAAARLKKK